MSRLLGGIGTIEWARRTNGILGRGEKARFTAAVVMKTSTVLPRVVAARRGWRGTGPDPSQLTPPDTPFAREVVEACAELEPMVVEHGYRSHLFARALGAGDGLECDEEALFAAVMFHDYAFLNMDEITDRCFTLAGAEIAEQALARSPLSPEALHDVLDAITLHLNPSVPPEHGVLQHLAHDGIALDVLGMRSWELEGAGIGRVAERHPRHGFTVDGAPTLKTNARLVSGCRAGSLFKAGFGMALGVGPWRGADRATATAAAA